MQDATGRIIARRTAAIAALGLMLAAGAPAAAEDRGFYIGGAVGVGFPNDSDLDSPTSSVSADLDAGFAGSLSVGHAYGNGWRTEIEFGYRENDVASISGTAATGDASGIGLMVNALYDFKVDWPVTPFLGAGLGFARVDVDGVSPVSGSSINDDDTGLALQAIAGLSYPVNDRLNLSLSYRYFAVPDLEFRTAAGTSIDSDYGAHTVMVGLRFRLGAPAPKPMPAPMPAAAPMPAPKPMPAPAPPPRVEAPPPPAPAPAPPRNFIVFFDWDRSVLTPQALAIVRSAAATAKQVAPVRLRLTGHADRSGPRRYNMGLSMRRAVSVKAEMMRLGIAERDIAIVARGEEEPLVPTADGVREPQNRRVEIILQ